MRCWQRGQKNLEFFEIDKIMIIIIMVADIRRLDDHLEIRLL